MKRLTVTLAFVVTVLLGAWVQPTIATASVTSETTAPACTASPFPDVPTTSLFCGDIAWFKAQHITTGYADHKFHPTASVSRQAMASFLYRLEYAGQTAPACTASPFPDVPKTSAFCGDIAWFKAQHVTTGYADHKFHPTAAVSRQAMASFLYRLQNAGREAPACTSSPFPDVPTTSLFCGDIAWFKAQHITTGYADHKFHPTASVSRQAMASFLYRLQHQGKAHPIKEFANCAAMHVYYPYGVGRPGAVDKTSGTPDTQFYVSTSLYQLNIKSDRDDDGIACEN